MSAKTDINVTPLIDIVLVLLIVFIIMVPGMMKSLPTVIPQIRKDSNPTPPDPKNPPLVLEINQDNSIALNQTPLENLRDIPERLVPLVMLQPAGTNMRKVFLSVDRDVPYDWAVQVMDQLRLTSERVKKETRESGVWDDPEFDGGDTKLVIRIKKRPGE
ncbi:MAG: biopolymer transporter ExbD [Holophagales bacterium]|jgi:biopolymer transport protein ExbD|nr:biopolymer transporter ExbD [Holophagales bacterium]